MNGCRCWCGCCCCCRSYPSLADSQTNGQVISLHFFPCDVFTVKCSRALVRDMRAMWWYGHCIRAPPLHRWLRKSNWKWNIFQIEDELPISIPSSASARSLLGRTQNIRQLNLKFINATLSICSMQKLLHGPTKRCIPIRHASPDSMCFLSVFFLLSSIINLSRSLFYRHKFMCIVHRIAARKN